MGDDVRMEKFMQIGYIINCEEKQYHLIINDYDN